MKLKFNILISICLLLIACGSGGSEGSSNLNINPATPTTIPSSGKYTYIQISPGNGSTCSNINTPCTTVTVCNENNPQQCDTITDVLVDTGSYGLRVFGSLLPNTNSSLQTLQYNGSPVAECVSYADNTSNWGLVKYAVVGLNGTLTQRAIPIQVLDSSVIGGNISCPGAVPNPAKFGINGIIGVGPLQNDQGFSNYYTCGNMISGFCQIISQFLTDFVTNPITAFPPEFNNGLTLVFGSVPQSGVVGADGYGIFGVGTVPSNTPPASERFQVFQIQSDSTLPLNVTTTLNNINYSSFLDTGSNLLFFSINSSNIPFCPQPDEDLFCPSTPFSSVGVMNGTDGLGNTSSANINFSIANIQQLVSTGNNAFVNVGGEFPVIDGIDWGLPFYLGRKVYMIFANESATINGITYPASTNGYWVF